MLDFHPFQRAQTGWIRENFYLEYHGNDLNIYNFRRLKQVRKIVERKTEIRRQKTLDVFTYGMTTTWFLSSWFIIYDNFYNRNLGYLSSIYIFRIYK